jgi:hypothetical protein
MDQAIQQLIEFIKTASPVIWATLVKEAYYQGITSLVWVLVFIVLAVLAFRYGKVSQKNYELELDREDRWGDKPGPRLDEYQIKYHVSYAAVPIILFITGIILNNAILWILNPEFHAITLLINQFK